MENNMKMSEFLVWNHPLVRLYSVKVDFMFAVSGFLPTDLILLPFSVIFIFHIQYFVPLVALHFKRLQILFYTCKSCKIKCQNIYILITSKCIFKRFI